jgi:hypothetical protein
MFDQMLDGPAAQTKYAKRASPTRAKITLAGANLLVALRCSFSSGNMNDPFFSD